jgi:hypothetical protein
MVAYAYAASHPEKVERLVEATRNFFTATYAQPGGMRAGFAQFAAGFDRQQNIRAGEIAMPGLSRVLACGRLRGCSCTRGASAQEPAKHQEKLCDHESGFQDGSG